jgi:D-arabinose 5-phosphate isomerase GutQ
VLPDQILATARAVIEREIASVASLTEQLDESFVAVASTLLECAGHVLVAGTGTSNPVAARLAHLLSCCGDSQHGLSGAVTARDVVIAVSRGGETAEVNHLARISKSRGATVIAFTEEPGSTLGRLSDLVLRIQPAPEADPFGMIATGSSLTVCAMADALCVVMLELRGYTRDAFASTHPGGAVGRMLSGQQGGDES